jgi:hypothetical protein
MCHPLLRVEITIGSASVLQNHGLFVLLVSALNRFTQRARELDQETVQSDNLRLTSTRKLTSYWRLRANHFSIMIKGAKDWFLGSFSPRSGIGKPQYRI